MPRPKAKLPVSTTTNALEFEPTEQFWAVVGKHLPALSDEQRGRLHRIIYTYYVSHQSTQSATDVAVAEGYLAKVEGTANTIWHMLNSSPDVDGGRQAALYVEGLLDEYLNRTGRSIFIGGSEIPEEEVYTTQPELEERDPESDWVRREWISQRLREMSVSRLAEAMGLLLRACQHAKARLDEDKRAEHYSPTEAWDGLVKHLAQFYQSFPGYKATATKDYDAEPSAFVCFVKDVQSEFAPTFRRPIQSMGAFSAKISDVLSSMKAPRETKAG